VRGAGGFESGAGGVAEAAVHTGYVAERRLFFAAVGEGAGGFAFEIDDEEVGPGFGLGAEELAQVVVAVDADALAEAGGVAVERGDASEEIVAVSEELVGEGDHFGG